MFQTVQRSANRLCVRLLPLPLKNGNHLSLRNSLKSIGVKLLWEKIQVGVPFLRVQVNVFNNYESPRVFFNV